MEAWIDTPLCFITPARIIVGLALVIVIDWIARLLIGGIED